MERRSVTVGGKPLGLSKTEFDLLACLMAAPGRVFTREMLLDRVWGDDAVVTDRPSTRTSRRSAARSPRCTRTRT